MTDNRKIRSFVLRQGRITTGQEQALSNYWHDFGLDYNAEKPLNFESIFGNHHPVYLEIGFGNGDSLAEMAASHLGRNYLGVEVHRPGVGRLLASIHDLELANLRVFHHDAIEVMEHMIPARSLTGIQLYFADPWPKKRHHKRRIVQQEFIDLIAKLIEPGGTFHAATDWQDYAEHILAVFTDNEDLFKNLAGRNHFFREKTERPRTKFETRGINKGHGVWDLIFERC